MRWRDEFTGLLAVTLLFGVVVLRAQDVGWAVLLPVLALALVLLGVMALRTRMTPKILIVGGPGVGPWYRLEEQVDDSGFGLRSCPGPEGRSCPVYEGKPCPVRGHPVAAVIYREAGAAGPLPPCGPALGVRTLAVEEGSDAPGSFGRREGHIGWERGPGDAVAAVRTLLSLSSR